MTHKEYILRKLKRYPDGLSVQDLVKAASKIHFGNTIHLNRYLSGSFSSLLRRMVLKGEVFINDSKGPRGGKVYIHKKYLL